MLETMIQFFADSGFAMMTPKNLIVIMISCIFLYLAIGKGYEPYLLIPISVGMLLANMPGVDLMNPPSEGKIGGLFYYLYQGVKLGIFPPLIFLCIGASTDFGPMIANPKTMLLGAAAQFGIFFAFIGAILLGFTGLQAASIGIIGGADGPTAIQLTGQLAPELLGTIALAAYSYMALIPVIQPPIIRALTTEKERNVKMEQLRVVSKKRENNIPSGSYDSSYRITSNNSRTYRNAYVW